MLLGKFILAQGCVCAHSPTNVYTLKYMCAPTLLSTVVMMRQLTSISSHYLCGDIYLLTLSVSDKYDMMSHQQMV